MRSTAHQKVTCVGGPREERQRRRAEGSSPSPEVPPSLQPVPEVALVSVAAVMASRLLRGAGALAAQALRARGPSGAAAVRSMASGGTYLLGVPKSGVLLPFPPQGGWCGTAKRGDRAPP